jgi:hypothetical protein
MNFIYENSDKLFIIAVIFACFFFFFIGIFSNGKRRNKSQDKAFKIDMELKYKERWDKIVKDAENID